MDEASIGSSPDVCNSQVEAKSQKLNLSLPQWGEGLMSIRLNIIKKLQSGVELIRIQVSWT